MSRARLTQRKTAADMSIPYPGNVNQPNRKDPSWEQYHTFEQRVNHELPDMSNDWKNDERDDIGFGQPEPWGESPNIPGALPPPTVASVRVAANKAVRIAVLLLGEKVEDDVIEAQARDLMTLSGEAMDRTLGRFAETQKLYADEEEDEDAKKAADEKDEEKKADEKEEDEKKAADEKDEDKKAADEKDEDKKAADKKEMPEFIKKKIEESKEKKGSAELADKADPKKAEDDDEDDEDDEEDEGKKAMSAQIAKLETVIASIKKSLDEKEEEKKAADEKEEEKKAAMKKDDKKKGADEKEEEKKATKKDEDKKGADEGEVKPGAEEDKKAADKDDEKKADDDDKEDEKKEAKKASPTDMDIELTSSMDDEVEPDPEADAQLASLFEDRTAAEEDVEQKPDASKKAGIKKLGGQPKVASTTGDGVTDISQLWETAPDVSEVFK